MHIRLSCVDPTNYDTSSDKFDAEYCVIKVKVTTVLALSFITWSGR